MIYRIGSVEDMQSIVFENNTINPKGEPPKRCRWQMKRGGEGAAVKIVNNYVVPDDFGKCTRALVQIAPKQPNQIPLLIQSCRQRFRRFIVVL